MRDKNQREVHVFNHIGGAIHRLLLLILAFLLPSMALSINSGSGIPLEQVTVQLKWLHQFQFAGYYAAIEKGFYRDAGLEVLLKEGEPGMNYTDEVVSGRADFGIDMPIILLERNKGKPVVALAAIFQHSAEAVMAKKDSGISTPHDFIGKRILLRPHGHAEIRAMLKNEGVPLEELKVVDHTWDINDLINDKVDLSGSYITDFPFLMQELGIPITVIRPLKYGIDFYGDCLFTSEMKIRQNPEQVNGFLSATLKGWEYAMDHQDELVDLILNKYSKRLSREALLFEAKAMEDLMQPKFIEMGHMNPGRWKHIGDTFVKLGMMKPNFSMDGFLYDSYRLKFLVKVMRIIWVLVGILLVLSLSAFTLYVFNRRLNKEVKARVKHLSTEIAERKRIEKNLKENESFLNSIFENIPNMIFIKEATDLRFVQFNKAGEHLLGIRRDELIGKNDYDLFSKEQADFFTQKDRETLKTKQMLDIPEEEIFSKEKGPRLLHTKKIPLMDDNGEPQFLLGISEDITEQKRTESELLKIKKIESIGVLAGGIAHDFNNILAAILGNINITLGDHALPGKSRHLLEKAEKASLRATKLTKQLLTFARGGQPVKETASLEEVIRESATFVLHGEKVFCEYNFPTDLWLVNIDKGQVGQVIQNLVINASQALPDGGLISISCENVEGKLLQNCQCEKVVKISIADNGIGIPETCLDKIFDPYFSTKKHGSGLGLAICQSIINKHNGQISVESTQGKGSTFVIYLPACERGEQRMSVEVDESEGALPPTKILIMDDDEMVQNVAQEMLTQLGHQVVLAADGLEAIELYRESLSTDGPIQILIMDLTIPGGMGGKEAVCEILKINPEAKVIVSSGYCSDPVMARFKDYGFCAALEKPFKMSELSKKLSEIGS